jgi:SEC-C motif
MKISRNAPCPCGSGRKYKDCCLPHDPERQHSTGQPSRDAFRAARETLVAARSEDWWEADVLPLPWTLGDDPDARPSLLAVMAGNLVVHSEVLRRPSGEESEVAAVLLAAVEDAAELVGRLPRDLAVRHPEVAVHMDPRLRVQGCSVRAEPHLSHLDRMAVEMAYRGDTTTERVSRLVLSRPDTWGAWGLEPALVGRIFAAASDFWRAAPWDVFLPFDIVEAGLPDGAAWYVAILGAPGPPRGVVLYADFDDCQTSASSDSLSDLVEKVEDRFYTVMFEGAASLPRPMRREVARGAWPVAEPAAYPRLMAVNTPAGGLSREDAAMLATVMDGVASLVRRNRDEILDDRWRTWADPSSGVRFTSVWPPADEPDDEGDGWAPDESGWPADDIGGDVDEATGNPILSNASPLQEILDEAGREELAELMGRTPPPDLAEVQDVLRRASDRHNARPQEELGGLSPEQVQGLLTADWSDPAGPLFVDRSLPASEVTGARMLRNAWAFLDGLAEEGGTRATAAGNLNRAFVARMRDVLESPHEPRDAVLDSYRQVVNEEDIGYLHLLRVVLEIGGLVKRRKSLWTATREGDRFRDRDRAGALLAHLFETVFRRLDLRGMDAVTAGEGFQYQVPFALHRFRDVGQVWATPAELAGRLLLPFVRESIPPSEHVDSAAILLERRFLAPLENLGLAERQEVPSPSRAFPRHRYRTSPLYERLLRLSP